MSFTISGSSVSSHSGRDLPFRFFPFLSFLLLPFRTSASCHFLLPLRKKPAAGMPVLRQGIAELNIFYINYFFCCITMTDIVI